MIIINNEEALRVKCEDVLPNEIADLRSILEKELNYANKLGKNGVGLAAPQIGIAKKIAIIRTTTFNLDLINARIEKEYDPTLFRSEGCLSFPGRVEDTIRFQEIYITNNLAEPNNLILSGFPAIVCQHELDHLNSTLFIDHIAPKNKLKLKIKPNDPCICGKIDMLTGKSKKYKKCCGRI